MVWATTYIGPLWNERGGLDSSHCVRMRDGCERVLWEGEGNIREMSVLSCNPCILSPIVISYIGALWSRPEFDRTRKNHGVFFLCMWYLSCVLGVDLASRRDRNRGGIRPQHICDGKNIGLFRYIPSKFLVFWNFPQITYIKSLSSKSFKSSKLPI